MGVHIRTQRATFTALGSSLFKDIKWRRCTSDLHMSFYQHFSYLENFKLAIHILYLLPTVKLPLAFSVDEVFQGDPSCRFSGFVGCRLLAYAIYLRFQLKNHALHLAIS